jgi:hypothetical protein
VQGRLRQEYLEVTINTYCAHCHQELKITISSSMEILNKTSEAEPLVFMPEVDWSTFSAPNIINDY